MTAKDGLNKFKLIGSPRRYSILNAPGAKTAPLRILVCSL
jgi:hypothetical protein